MNYPDDYGEEAVASREKEATVRMLIWIGAGVVAVSVLAGVSKLLAEMKSSNLAARRPRRPWEVLP